MLTCSLTTRQRLAVGTLDEGVLHRRDLVGDGPHDRVADEVGEADLGLPGAGAEPVDDLAVDLEQLGRDVAEAGGGREPSRLRSMFAAIAAPAPRIGLPGSGSGFRRGRRSRRSGRRGRWPGRGGRWCGRLFRDRARWEAPSRGRRRSRGCAWKRRRPRPEKGVASDSRRESCHESRTEFGSWTNCSYISSTSHQFVAKSDPDPFAATTRSSVPPCRCGDSG